MIVSIRSFRKFGFSRSSAARAAAGAAATTSRLRPPTQPGRLRDTTATTETQTESTAASPDPATETLPNDGDGTGHGRERRRRRRRRGGGPDARAVHRQNGGITPRKVRVPAFISIRVELRSGDGADYSLTFGDKTIKVQDPLTSVSTKFDGLRPARSWSGQPTGASGKVVI